MPRHERIDNSLGQQTYLAGRFRRDSPSVYSFSAALHSVRKSGERANRFIHACDAEWIAAAGFKCFSFIKPSNSLGTSNQNPLTCFSYGGVLMSTKSFILPLLKNASKLTNYQPTSNAPDFQEACDNLSIESFTLWNSTYQKQQLSHQLLCAGYKRLFMISNLSHSLPKYDRCGDLAISLIRWVCLASTSLLIKLR